MNHLTRCVLISLLATLALIAGGSDRLRAATIPCAKGDPVFCADTDTVDVPFLRQNGVLVGTATGNPIVTVRANQALPASGAGAVIQHANSTLVIEYVQISSTGGALTSSASPRILDGVNGQTIVLQGTSAANSYTIPDGTGVKFTTAASVTFDDRCSMMLRFDTANDWWREVARACGAVGGGGGGLELAPVRALVGAGTNINIAAPGTTLDGLTFSSGQSVALNGQSTASQNGIYLYNGSAALMSRRPDLDVSGEWALGLHFTVQEGTQAGTRWELANLTPPIQGTDAVSFRRQALGPLGELIANRSTVATSVPNGTIGSDANGRVPYNRLGSSAVHTTLATANAINPTTTNSFEIGIAGTSVGITDLTSNPQIVAGIDGQLLILYGTSASNTVQFDDVTVQAAGGVRLCGGKGSVVVGLNNDDLILQYRTTLAAWVQQACQSLQSAYNTGRDIFGLTSTGTALRLGADANNHLRVYTSAGETRIEGITGGSPNANHTVNLGTGGDFLVKNNVGATLFGVDNDTGAITGTVSTTGGVCQVIDNLTSADVDRLLDATNRARTVTGVWCNYAGAAPTLAATFTLEDGSNNPMTITGTNPTCAAAGTVATVAAVTGGNTLTAREVLRFNVTNSPNPSSNSYILCSQWTITD